MSLRSRCRPRISSPEVHVLPTMATSRECTETLHPRHSSISGASTLSTPGNDTVLYITSPWASLRPDLSLSLNSSATHSRLPIICHCYPRRGLHIIRQVANNSSLNVSQRPNLPSMKPAKQITTSSTETPARHHLFLTSKATHSLTRSRSSGQALSLLGLYSHGLSRRQQSSLQPARFNPSPDSPNLAPPLFHAPQITPLIPPEPQITITSKNAPTPKASQNQPHRDLPWLRHQQPRHQIFSHTSDHITRLFLPRLLLPLPPPPSACSSSPIEAQNGSQRTSLHLQNRCVRTSRTIVQRQRRSRGIGISATEHKHTRD